MTRTLLVEMGVPHYLWTDALLTSVCLLNRLPSSPLGGEVPLHRLHPTRDLFVLPPRVFGCVAFVHDHTPNLSKLAPRSIKGVFVGYSRKQKGYRIYLPEQCKYVISADVTFFEDTRYFTSSSTPIFSPPSLQPLTRRNREVIDFKRYRVKNYTELTNLMKMYRIQGYNGKYGSNPQGI